MNKRLLYEILTIVLVASAIGFLYNAFVKDPIPIIYKEKPKIAVDDSILFSSPEPITTKAVDNTDQSTMEEDTTVINIEQDTCKRVHIDEDDMPEQTIKEPQIKKQIADTDLYPSKKQGKLFGHIKDFNNWVSIEQVKKAVGTSNIQFIDAREPEALEKGKIGNAINIFPEFGDDEDEQEYFETILTLDEDMTFIIYCNGYDCDLAEMVARDILSFGHVGKVFIFPGGWDEWVKHADT